MGGHAKFPGETTQSCEAAALSHYHDVSVQIVSADIVAFASIGSVHVVAHADFCSQTFT
jgi:hypothetical protein